MKGNHYKTVFISDIHLWNPKNQSDKLIKFLDSITFENLIIIWDFIDYRQLRWFWKRWEKEQATLNYINDLSQKWVKITYIQWNHDRKLECSKKIKIENMTICREMYYQTLKWKTYYITHWDCMDTVNEELNYLWQLWSIVYGALLRIESLRNKQVFSSTCISFSEKLDLLIRKWRMPESKVKRKIKNFSKNLNCDWLIIWHFHLNRHYEINWIDYFNAWDWMNNCSAVTENLKWNLELIKYKSFE